MLVFQVRRSNARGSPAAAHRFLAPRPSGAAACWAATSSVVPSVQCLQSPVGKQAPEAGRAITSARHRSLAIRAAVA